MKVHRASPTQLDIRKGSEAALRLKGAPFTKAEQFPVVAAIECTETESGSLVRINVLDDLGPAIRLGMKKKMEEAVNLLAREIVTEIQAKHDPLPPPNTPTEAKPSDTVEKLVQLKDLLDRNAITQEEFDREKQKLLGD